MSDPGPGDRGAVEDDATASSGPGDEPARAEEGTSDAEEGAAESEERTADAEEGAADAEEGTADGEERAAAEESADADDREDLEALRRRVEEEYDFEEFGPADMAEMEPEEWEAAFDADAWITGEALLDRVEADLKYRVATRDVFAVVERVTHEGRPCVLAYTDAGYALVEPDGSVEGFGTVLRDAKPVVALCSMESYDVPEEPPAEYLLPHPEEVPEGSGELGNVMVQVVAGVHVLAGLGLLVAALYLGTASFLGLSVPGAAAGASGGAAAISIVVGIVFLVIGLALFATVANARLSDAFRAEEYRERLRTMGLEDGERPDFLPVSDRGRELTDDDRGEQ